MKVMILAAGYGTRLAAVIKDTPKPLIPINSKPLIEHILDMLKGLPGITEAVVVTNNKFHTHFENWAKIQRDIKLRIVNDGTNTNEDRLGSVGDINFVWDREREVDDWLVIGGDNLFDQNLKEFMQFALSKAPAISIGAYDIHEKEAATKFGVIALDGNRKVVSFEEKPAEPKSSLITMCLYYFPQMTVSYLKEYLSESKALDAAGSYIKWLSEKKNVYGFQFKGKWYDIGSVESLYEAQKQFK